MKRRNFFLAAGIIALLITALLMVSNIFSLIDHISLLLIVMSLLLTAAGDSWRGLFAAISAGLKGKEIERESSLQHLASLKSFENLVLICGAAVSLAGNIGAMAMLKTPELIGPFVAMALTGAFTAIFVSRLLIFPLRLRIKCRLGEVPDKFAPGFWPDLALIGFPLISYLTINMIIFSF